MSGEDGRANKDRKPGTMGTSGIYGVRGVGKEGMVSRGKEIDEGAEGGLGGWKEVDGFQGGPGNRRVNLGLLNCWRGRKKQKTIDTYT